MTGKRRKAKPLDKRETKLIEDAKAGELHGFAAGVACGVCGDRVQAVMARSWAAARDGEGVCVDCVVGKVEQVAVAVAEVVDTIVTPPAAEATASAAEYHERPKRKRRRRSTNERLDGKAGTVSEEA